MPAVAKASPSFRSVFPERHSKRITEFEYRLRFSVKSGAASFLGRLHLQLGERDSQKLRLEDKRDSDLAAFSRKYPQLDGVAIGIGKLEP